MNTSKWGAIAATWFVGTFSGTPAQAALQQAGSSLISHVQSYMEVGSGTGDVLVQLASNTLSSSCFDGFWIRGSDIGAKNALTQILAAYHTGLPVVIEADTAVWWTGNPATRYCLVWSLKS
jgi:hypothetical protein